MTAPKPIVPRPHSRSQCRRIAIQSGQPWPQDPDAPGPAARTCEPGQAAEHVEQLRQRVRAMSGDEVIALWEQLRTAGNSPEDRAFAAGLEEGAALALSTCEHLRPPSLDEILSPRPARASITSAAAEQAVECWAVFDARTGAHRISRFACGDEDSQEEKRQCEAFASVLPSPARIVHLVDAAEADRLRAELGRTVEALRAIVTARDRLYEAVQRGKPDAPGLAVPMYASIDAARAILAEHEQKGGVR